MKRDVIDEINGKLAYFEQRRFSKYYRTIEKVWFKGYLQAFVDIGLINSDECNRFMVKAIKYIKEITDDS